MRHFWLFAHSFGFVLWMGGAFSAMAMGAVMRRGPRTDLPALIGAQGALYRWLILPGCVMVVISGLVLTLRLYGNATSVNGFPPQLMVMQGAGLVGAAIVLVVSFPTMGRISRLDPLGEHAPLFKALSRRMVIAGSIAGVLGMAALVSGVLLG